MDFTLSCQPHTTALSKNMFMIYEKDAFSIAQKMNGGNMDSTSLPTLDRPGRIPTDLLTPENRFTVGRIFRLTEDLEVVVKAFDGLRLTLDRHKKFRGRFRSAIKGTPIIVEGCICMVRNVSEKRLWLIIVETKEQAEAKAAEAKKLKEQGNNTTKTKVAVHMDNNGSPLCNAASAKNLTDDVVEVTCKRCRKKLDA